MPLLDHFRPPLSLRRHWHSFHHAWFTYLASHLNEQLPEGYFAEPNVQFGLEIDVATFDDETATPFTLIGSRRNQRRRFPFLSPAMWSRYKSSAATVGRNSPARSSSLVRRTRTVPEHRDAFVNKCAAYLQQGVGLLQVDVVSQRAANLHEALLARLGHEVDSSSELYATSYRMVERDERSELDYWHHSLHFGDALPALPLWLRGNICLRVDLEATYERTRREQRVA